MNVWSIQPDWSNPVTENLAWLTDVMRGQSGAEQRRAMRLSPRRTVEYDFLCDGPRRALFDLAVTRGGADTWLLPLWWDCGLMTGTYNAGSPAIGIDTTNTEFLAGTQCVIYGDEFTYEVHNISSVSASTLQFSEVTSKSWKKGTRVLPVRQARFTEQPSISKLTSRVAQGTVKFQMTLNNDNVTGAVGADVYGAYPVVTDGPNERDGIEVAWDRLTTQLDDDVSLVLQVDSSGIGFYKQKHLMTMIGKQQHADFRKMLYTLQGQFSVAWLPTFADDFEIVGSTNGGTIDVHNVGYASYGVNLTGKTDIMISMKDGSRYYARITGSTNLGNGNERLAVNVSHFAQTLSPSSVQRISFMTLSRMETDAIDISHITDSFGVSEALLSFVSSPEIRNVV